MVGKHATPTKGRTNDQSSGLSTESVVASNGLLMRAGNVRSCRRIADVTSDGLLMRADNVGSCRRIAFGVMATKHGWHENCERRVLQ